MLLEKPETNINQVAALVLKTRSAVIAQYVNQANTNQEDAQVY